MVDKQLEEEGVALFQPSSVFFVFFVGPNYLRIEPNFLLFWPIVICAVNLANGGPVFCSQPANQMVRGIADTSEMLVVKAKSSFPDLTGSLHCAFLFCALHQVTNVSLTTDRAQQGTFEIGNDS